MQFVCLSGSFAVTSFRHKCKTKRGISGFALVCPRSRRQATFSFFHNMSNTQSVLMVLATGLQYSGVRTCHVQFHKNRSVWREPLSCVQSSQQLPFHYMQRRCGQNCAGSSYGLHQRIIYRRFLAERIARLFFWKSIQGSLWRRDRRLWKPPGIFPTCISPLCYEDW